MFSRFLWYALTLKRNQWLKPEELLKKQTRMLRTMIKYAYENVEFHHRRFDRAGIKPDDIKTVNDLSKLPIMKKDDLRGNSPARLVGKETRIDDCIISSTSGTTSKPVTLAWDQKCFEYDSAHTLRSLMAIGVRPWSKLVNLSFLGSEPSRLAASPGVGAKRGKRDLVFGPLAPLYGYFTNKLFIQFSIEEIMRVIINRKSPIIMGHPSWLVLLGEAMKKRGANDFRPKAIQTRGEILASGIREHIEDLFECQVYDLYGTNEIGTLGWECKERQGKHMNLDFHVIEFLKDGEPVAQGERGEMVITSVFNHAMPLIRYRVNDVGVADDDLCPCGRGLPLMKKVEGRLEDFLHFSNGLHLSPLEVMSAYSSIPCLSRYQVIQKNERHIIIRLIGPEQATDSIIEPLMERSKEIFGQEIAVEIKVDGEEQVKQKLQHIVSNNSSSPIYHTPR